MNLKALFSPLPLALSVRWSRPISGRPSGGIKLVREQASSPASWAQCSSCLCGDLSRAAARSAAFQVSYPALSYRQDIELGANCVHRRFDDGADTWNGEHPIDQLIEIGLDCSKCRSHSLLCVWRQLFEQLRQLIKFRGSLVDRRNGGLRSCVVFDARE